MPTVKQIVLEVSKDMNDQQKNHEYVRWPIPDLLSYLRDAVASLSSFRPDAFTSTETLALQPGRMQRLPDGAVSLSSVDANTDGGESPVLIADFKLARAFNPRNCAGSGTSNDCNGNPEYKVRTFTYDPKNPRVYYVSPPVPQGGSYTLTATVIREPTEIGNANWFEDVGVDLKYVPIIKDFMMGKAYNRDTESTSSVRTGQMHMAAYYAALGINYKQESKFHSGFYLGQRGDGDPQAGVR